MALEAGVKQIQLLAGIQNLSLGSTYTLGHSRFSFQYMDQTITWTIVVHGHNGFPDVFFDTKFDKGFAPGIEELLPIMRSWTGRPSDYTSFMSKLLQIYVIWHKQTLRQHPCYVLRDTQLTEDTNDHVILQLQNVIRLLSALVLCIADPERPRLPKVVMQASLQDIIADHSNCPAPITDILQTSRGVVTIMYAPTSEVSVHTEVILHGYEKLSKALSIKERDFSLQTTSFIPPADVLLQFKQIIQNAIERYRDNLTRSRVYVAALISLFRGALLEYDDIEFKWCSFLLQREDFFVYVHVGLGRRFPDEQPIVTLQSIYHEDVRGDAVKRQYNTYPYSPRWDGMEMAKRLRAFLETEIPQFKSISWQQQQIHQPVGPYRQQQYNTQVPSHSQYRSGHPSHYRFLP
eukprot:gene9745-1948_t